jgi:hypothetical protein
MIYADLARSKALWAHRRLDDPLSKRFAREGAEAARLLAETPSTTPTDILTKLTELQEVTAPDITSDAIELLLSIIEDVHRLFDRPAAPQARTEPATASAPVADRPKVRIDRRARPVTVDGVLYPSITAAAVATGQSYETLRQSTG